MLKCKLCSNRRYSKHWRCLYCQDCKNKKYLPHAKLHRQQSFDKYSLIRNATNKKNVRDLNDTYIVNTLCAKSTLKKADLTQQLIDMKRLELQLRRQRRSYNAKNNGTQSKETSSEDCKGL